MFKSFAGMQSKGRFSSPVMEVGLLLADATEYFSEVHSRLHGGGREQSVDKREK